MAKVLTGLSAVVAGIVAAVSLSVGCALSEPGARSGAQVKSIECGKPAPAFTLPDSRGGKRSLSDYAGKVVVLEWVNFDCPFVRKHYDSKNMQGLQKFASDRGVVWLTVCSSADGRQGNFEAAEINRRIKEKGATPTAYLIDAGGATGIAYGARSTPHMYIVDPKGILIYQGAIDDIASTDITDVPKANNYVRQALTEALAGKPVSVASTKAYGCSVKY